MKTPWRDSANGAEQEKKPVIREQIFSETLSLPEKRTKWWKEVLEVCSLSWLDELFVPKDEDGQQWLYRPQLYPPGGRDTAMRTCPRCKMICPPAIVGRPVCDYCQTEIEETEFVKRARRLRKWDGGSKDAAWEIVRRGWPAWPCASMFGVDWDNRPSESVHATDNSEQLVSLADAWSANEDYELDRNLEQHTVDCLGDSHSEDSINFDLREHNRDDGPQEQSHLRSLEFHETASDLLWSNLSKKDCQKISSWLCAPGCSLRLVPMEERTLEKEIEKFKCTGRLMANRQLENITWRS